MQKIHAGDDRRKAGKFVRVAYLGPPGTFTEAAAASYKPDADLLPVATISSVAASVQKGEAERGIVPVENSLQGAVTDTLDVLIHGDGVLVCGELILPIVHNMLTKPGTSIGDIQVVYSHPQALGQCRLFLQDYQPTVQLRASLSTAAAVEEMLRSNAPAAAIAPLRAAELYGAEVAVEGIQDNPSNETRFLVLAPEDYARTGHDKTSICFSFSDDRPGQLYGVMRELAERNINLSKVESRPTREGLGQYYFLLDLEGHRQDTLISEALDALGRATSMLKVFGSYPQFIRP